MKEPLIREKSVSLKNMSSLESLKESWSEFLMGIMKWLRKMLVD